MDIDVKNALDKVLSVCTSVGTVNGKDLMDTFAADICSYIKYISKSGASERFDLFSIMYLKGIYSSGILSDEKVKKSPDSLELFRTIDKSILKNREIESTKLLTAFFISLGRYYMSSNYDRKDIDSGRFLDVIKALGETQEKKQISDIKPSGFEEVKKTVSVNNVKSKQNETEEEIIVSEPEETLEELLARLDSLIGLEGVKKEVRQIINLVKVQKKGEEFGEKLPPLSLHLVFWGNPGTGKTTVARLLGKIYKSLGVIATGQLIEVDRGGLVAGYVGQTATKTQEVIDRAMGGILFIDEAYTLTHGKGDTDFGQEAVDTLLKAMEDHRDNFVVIVAGYPDLMKEFVASNPGLKSRFNQFINFEDYKPDELLEIFKLQCKNQNLILGQGCEVYLSEFFLKMYNNRGKNYANGRDVRNYFEGVYKARANRLAGVLDNITREDYLTITVEDLNEAANARKSF